MSYDLLVFDPKDAPRERDAFLDWYQAQVESPEGQLEDSSQTTQHLSAWYSAMCQSFPDMNSPSVGEENPRATGYSIGRSTILADFRWSEAGIAYATVRALAVKHGVGFFHMSGDNGEIWFPPTGHAPDQAPIPGLELTLESQQAFKPSSIALIEAAVDWLQPDGGPGFLVLENDAARDYTQVGGGKDACTLEWREYLDGGFRHWVAGIPGADPEKEIRIPGNGTHFVIRENERLSNENIKAILGSFAQGKPRPQEFIWRDITARFR